MAAGHQGRGKVGMREFWISAYDQWGHLFGASIEAKDTNDMFHRFANEYPDSDIADYGEYDD